MVEEGSNGAWVGLLNFSLIMPSSGCSTQCLNRLCLEKSKGKGGGDTDATAAAYKEKMVAMNKNFASLQAEYDQATRDVLIRLVPDVCPKESNTLQMVSCL